MKRYGDTKTALNLTEKAFAAYSETDPLDIYEHDDGSYSMRGACEFNNLTAADVNDILEDFYDQTHDEC